MALGGDAICGCSTKPLPLGMSASQACWVSVVGDPMNVWFSCQTCGVCPDDAAGAYQYDYFDDDQHFVEELRTRISIHEETANGPVAPRGTDEGSKQHEEHV